MLGKLGRIFADGSLALDVQADGAPTSHNGKLAIVRVLFEAVEANGTIITEEIDELFSAAEKLLGLTKSEIPALVHEALAQKKAGSELALAYDIIRQTFSERQLFALLEAIKDILAADGEIQIQEREFLDGAHRALGL